MTRLTKLQCLEWLDANQLEQEEKGHHFYATDRQVYAIDVVQPTTSRGLALVAHNMARAVGCGEVILLVVTDWGTWPSEESWPLFDRAMIGYGDSRSLGEAPGLLFKADEVSDLAALIRMALISGWSAGVVSPQSPIGFALTDDDWFGVFANSADIAQNWMKSTWSNQPLPKVLWQGTL